jgi:hypothetical protein
VRIRAPGALPLNAGVLQTWLTILDQQDGVAAGQRLIACANPSTGRAGQRTNTLRRFLSCTLTSPFSGSRLHGAPFTATGAGR